MISRDIEKTFPLGQKLPEPIADICSYLDKNGYPISGCFELSTIGVEDMNHWFKKTPEAVKLLMPFGRGACGDVYSLWLIDNIAAPQAPVVIFGSEGELQVLASNPLEFCRLLCLGYSELGLEDHSQPGEDYEETKPFRDYMISKYQFELPLTGQSIIDKANRDYPGFKEWVAKNAW